MPLRNQAFWNRFLGRWCHLGRTPLPRHRRVFLEGLEDRHLLAPGDLDLSFGGGDGIVTTSSVFLSQAVALGGAGSYVVAGNSMNGVNQDFGLARFTSAGVLDTSFGGGDGIVTADIPASSLDYAQSVAVDGAGKYLVAGHSQGDFALARFTPGGLLDLSFGGGDGIVTSDFGFDDLASSVAVDSAGNYVVAGKSNGSFALTRYTPAGVLDLAFGGGDGIVTANLTVSFAYSGLSVAVDAVGNYVVAGNAHNGSNYDFALARFTSGGVLDLSFGGGDGVVTTSIGQADDIGASVAVDGAGNYVVAGHSHNGSNNDFAIARYTSTGVLDFSFGGGDGIVTTPIGGGDDFGRSVAVDGAGNLVVTGDSHNGASEDFALTRYTSAGVLDPTFGGGDGILTTPIGASWGIGRSVAVDANGKYVVAGYVGPDFSSALARYEGIPPASLSPVLLSGHLSVNDVFTEGKNNQLSISTDGVNLIIADALERFMFAPSGWTFGSTNASIKRPLAGFTGSITFNGGLGTDTLTVHLTSGDIIPSGNITFNGGGPTTGFGDSLVIVGGSQGTVTYNYTNTHDGNINLSNFGSVNYTGVESLANLGSATDAVFNLPSIAGSTTLGDDGVQFNGGSRLSSATISRTDFTNPTGSVTINRGNAAETLTVGFVPDLSASLTIGSAAAEFNVLQFAGTLSLAVGKHLTGFGTNIETSAALTTNGGHISLTASGNIALRSPLFTNGGIVGLFADGDGNGSGTLTLAAGNAQLIDPNPAPGNRFGDSVVPLTTGNVVVTSPFDDAGGADAGAVYLFNGFTGALISTLRGSSGNDSVGSGGITALSNGNYVVRSHTWNNGIAGDAGAVTWGSGTTGVSGVVSAANSLVGSSASDNIGDRIVPLSNGNYVVSSPFWNHGSAVDAGAVTWGNGTTGVAGVISASNSLVGSTSSDNVGGSFGVTALSNGNYVVNSPNWDNGIAANAGAVTWGSGTAGATGVVSTANSLVGSSAGDFVGSREITALTNGNYVVTSPGWRNGAAANAGAVTWGNGTAGALGVVSAGNSLVGSSADDYVGGHGVTALTNGNYIVSSSEWDSGVAANVGAVTWGSGTAGVKGVISAANSLVGSTADDFVGGFGRITVLPNGNYVVSSLDWNNGIVENAGAITWGNGASGVSGVVSATNSLVGSTAGDFMDNDDITVLTNGNYVVWSTVWDNGAATDAGAVTWGNGASGVSGVVSAINSLVGSAANDSVGNVGVTALANGNYVVQSSVWDNGATADAGAVTWGNGASGVSGVVSPINSLVGSTANDLVGDNGITALTNGNFVVSSPFWNNGAASDAGAVTWGNGTTGVSGVISVANSLVGTAGADFVGINGVRPLTNGNYLVTSTRWDNGLLADVGAVTWGSGTVGVTGVVNAANSLVGSSPFDRIGSGGNFALTNGNYVVSNPNWDNGAATDAGAVTWGSGTAGVNGLVSPANSLVGTTAGDSVGNGGIRSLTNGHYVITSFSWNNGAATDAGAVTWGNGTVGVTGVVSSGNSLVGSTIDDRVGSSGITPLSNGNYLVYSSNWDNGPVLSAGALTWGSGTAGVTGPINGINSAVGYQSGSFPSTSIGDQDSFYVRIPNDGNGRVVTGSQATGFAAPGTVNAGVGNVDLFAADVVLDTSIRTTASVLISPTQFGRPMALGTTTAGSLSLTDAELDRITASTLILGGDGTPFNPGSPTGTITINGAIQHSGDSHLQIATARNIAFLSASSLTTVNGNIRLAANQQPTSTSGNFVGINLNGSTVSSTSGNITLTGRGGNDAAGVQLGISLENGADITGGATGQVTLNGRGGPGSGDGNSGVYIVNAGTSVTTAGGPLQIIGQGDGVGSGVFHQGVIIADSALIAAGGSGTVTIQGTGGPTSGGNHHGVQLFAATVTSGGGNIQITGQAGAGGGVDVYLGVHPATLLSTPAAGGSITVTGNDLIIGGTISAGAASSITLRPLSAGFTWNLGAHLTDAELDLVTAGTLVIGSSTAGTLTVSANLSRPANTNLQLISGGDIVFNGGSVNTAGGTLLLNAGPLASIKPITSGVDVVASTVTLAGNLSINITGSQVPDLHYDRLNVTGQVNLNGVGLIVTGSYLPVGGDSFLVVNNDASDPVIGTFGFQPVATILTYAAGDGNDVALSLPNGTPTISDILNQSTDEDIALNNIPFSIGDPETVAAALLVSATSSDTTLFPVGNITFGGSGASRTINLAPAANQSGSATITVTVSDGNGGTAVDTFVMTVSAVNDNPTISNIANQSTTSGLPVLSVPFTIGDIEAAANSLIVTATSSDTTLFPVGSITLAGAGANRTISLAPTANQLGAATITVTVNDGDGGTAVDTFVVTIVAPWQNPVNPLNVNNSAGPGPIITAFDALAIINELNTLTIMNPTTFVLPTPAGSIAPPPYLDVNGDNKCTAFDALAVINFLNLNSGGEYVPPNGGEGAEVSVGPIESSKPEVELKMQSAKWSTALPRRSLNEAGNLTSADGVAWLLFAADANKPIISTTPEESFEDRAHLNDRALEVLLAETI